MIEDMRIRNLSPQTQRAYVEQVSRFALHFGQSPERLGQDEIRAWQIYLVEERRLAASSISVAVAALRFVYTVTALVHVWTDGPSDARGKVRILTGGSIAIMCPA
jgi:site-specific recombinase XerD